MSVEKARRRGRLKTLEDTLRFLSSYNHPHTIYEASRLSGIDYNTLRRVYQVFELIAEYKIIALPIEGYSKLYAPVKLELEKPRIG